MVPQLRLLVQGPWSTSRVAWLHSLAGVRFKAFPNFRPAVPFSFSPTAAHLFTSENSFASLCLVRTGRFSGVRRAWPLLPVAALEAAWRAGWSHWVVPSALLLHLFRGGYEEKCVETLTWPCSSSCSGGRLGMGTGCTGAPLPLPLCCLIYAESKETVTDDTQSFKEEVEGGRPAFLEGGRDS